MEKFLEFNGTRISVLSSNGTWYIAIKPICEALKVDYIEQFKNLKSDEILNQLLCERTTVAADGKMRNMACLPERYVYGWLFSIRSDSQDLKAYRLKCYDILYAHFHGAMTARVDTLQQRSEVDSQIVALRQKIDESPYAMEIQELKRKKAEISARLKKIDRDLLAGQLTLDL